MAYEEGQFINKCKKMHNGKIVFQSITRKGIFFIVTSQNMQYLRQWTQSNLRQLCRENFDT